jgi:hypothetical protein
MKKNSFIWAAFVVVLLSVNFSACKKDGDENVLSKTVVKERAGTINQFINEKEKYSIQNLTISGPLDGTDIKFIREMALSGEGQLRYLDMTNTTIVAGGASYEFYVYTYEENEILLTEDNVFPRRFFYGSMLQTIKLPNTIQAIGNGAFDGCYDLSSITIPNNVTNIGGAAFRDCMGLSSITISNNVTSIGENVFSGCVSLSSITIPNNVTSIEENAFIGCASLSSITISNNVTSIGDGAFCGCASLSSITIPNNVTSIGDYAFERCTELNAIHIKAKTPPQIDTKNQPFKDIADGCILYVPQDCASAYESWKGYFSQIVEE